MLLQSISQQAFAAEFTINTKQTSSSQTRKEEEEASKHLEHNYLAQVSASKQNPLPSFVFPSTSLENQNFMKTDQTIAKLKEMKPNWKSKRTITLSEESQTQDLIDPMMIDFISSQIHSSRAQFPAVIEEMTLAGSNFGYQISV